MKISPTQHFCNSHRANHYIEISDKYMLPDLHVFVTSIDVMIGTQ